MELSDYIEAYQGNELILGTLVNTFSVAFREAMYDNKPLPKALLPNGVDNEEAAAMYNEQLETAVYSKQKFEESGLADYFRRPEIQKKVLDATAEKITKNIKENGLKANPAYDSFDKMVTYELGQVLGDIAFEDPTITSIAQKLSADTKIVSEYIKNTPFGDGEIDNRTPHMMLNEFAAYFSVILKDNYLKMLAERNN